MVLACIKCGSSALRGDYCSDCAEKRKDAACICGKKLLRWHHRCQGCSSSVIAEVPALKQGYRQSAVPEEPRGRKAKKEWLEYLRQKAEQHRRENSA